MPLASSALKKPVPPQDKPEAARKEAKPVAYESSGPALLALQPAKVSEGSDKAAPGWQRLRSHLEQRLASLRNWRNSWWMQNWCDLSQYIMPRRSTWLTQSSGGMPNPNSMTRGRNINTSIVDPTATYAVRTCSGGLMSGLASPSRPWFKMVPALKNFEPDAAGRAWLDETETRMYTVAATSNFYNKFAQECEDLVVFGTAPNIIYEDETDIIRVYTPAVGEYYLASSATERIDAIYRSFVFTVSQIVDFFGLENCSPSVQKQWSQKGGALDMEHTVCHCIEPNFDCGESTRLPGKYTWREVYWLYGADTTKPLSVRGFHECPFTVPRWSTLSNDPYGRSPGMDVLPDVIQLQVLTRRLAEAIEKQVRPPLVADMRLKNQPSSILPGHVTYVDQLGPGTGMRPIYEVNPDINGLAALIQQTQLRIQKGLFNDLFLMLEQAAGAKMTAYEVGQRMQEKLQVLGPVIEGMLSESLKPKLKRMYSIMTRKGMIDPPPPSLHGVPLDIEFVSMLALAQKAAATGGLERFIGIVGNMAAVYPEVKDLVDTDAFLREFSDLLGNPQKILRGPEQVKAIRLQAAKQQQAAAKMQMLSHAAQVVPQAAQTLAGTQVGAGNTALNMMLGVSPNQ